MKFGNLAYTTYKNKYAHTKVDGEKETWTEVCDRVVNNVMAVIPVSTEEIEAIRRMFYNRIFMAGGRYYAASGRQKHQVQNCFALDVEDSAQGWGELMSNATQALMSGGGIGVNYSKIRAEGELIKSTGGMSSGVIPLINIINSICASVREGSYRRSASMAILNWAHKDIFKFINAKNEEGVLRETNISVELDRAFFESIEGYGIYEHKPLYYRNSDICGHANTVFSAIVDGMLSHGEPGITVSLGKAEDEKLRNACGELSSDTDSDVCNLGSINLSRIRSIDEMREAVRIGTLFLFAGSIYSDLPYKKVGEIRERHRRLGLGLMGVHDFLIQHKVGYGDEEALKPYLEIYAESGEYAMTYAKKYGYSIPIKTRAIAPTGTISLIGETTSGIEPIFCTAYKRRYFIGNNVIEYQYVVDPVAKKLLDSGVKEEDIEDAYLLANDIERRLRFQAFLQRYVDMGISSTINLPQHVTSTHASKASKIKTLLLTYLPKLRGVTMYPDGARGLQPITKCSIEEAMNNIGKVYEESVNVCNLKGGGCNE